MPSDQQGSKIFRTVFLFGRKPHTMPNKIPITLEIDE